ncbi:MAG: hypothetical protein AMXMBFR13_13660 [Phycisphaerae bacterium]
MAEAAITPRTYIFVFIWLLALLAITIVLAFVPMGVWGTVVGYSIAMVKAVLIMLYFMHVRNASHLTWVFAGAAFLWLGILFVLTLSDYTTRGWLPLSESLRPAIEPLIPPPRDA